jgi:hypothetical protein
LLSIIAKTLPQFGLTLSFSHPVNSGSHGSYDDLTPQQEQETTSNSDLLLTSFFDVESLISDLTQVLLVEMRDWVVKIRLVSLLPPPPLSWISCYLRSGRGRRRMS